MEKTPQQGENEVARIRVANATQTRAVGQALAKYLRAGDVIMLSGGLGAGKTTFTQGIGAGMGVRGHVASPTFIVARVHPPVSGNVPLIHADAYRITGLEDLETLDLDSSVDEAVTVIEWGEGKTEALSSSRLEIVVQRETGSDKPAVAAGDVIDLESLDDGNRTLIIRSFGPRWEGVDFSPLAQAATAIETEETN